jgi:hypothetical protein
MENPDFEDSKVPIYVYGTSGYGKSYLLAALVCQLLKEGKRVVYFPDCQELAEDAYTTFLDALRFAYYDDPASLQKINSVLFIANADARLLALTDFWRENCDAYLVADQLNALESENDAKKRALELLVTLGYKHPYISSASANEKANRTLAAKQQNMEIVKFYGGMDKVCNPPFNGLLLTINCEE